jgi:hypothetical protein
MVKATILETGMAMRHVRTPVGDTIKASRVTTRIMTAITISIILVVIGETTGVTMAEEA